MAEYNSQERLIRIPGAELPYGSYKEGSFSDDELWSALCGAFSSKASHSTSYKYAFMKAILDNLYNVDDSYSLSFDQLFSKFAEIYWNLILKYKVRQMPVNKSGKFSLIERILWDARTKYQLAEDVPFESLKNHMREDISRQVKAKCKTNVVGALYGDTMGLFYSFNKAKEQFQLNPLMYEFLCRHKVFVEKVNYFEWARYLEKINDAQSTMHLLSKLDESAKRNNLSPYRQLLYDEFEYRKCFYCGRSLSGDKIHVDHFVPWSFIKDDKLWNFVLACPYCNMHKKDKLPVIDYLQNIETRNLEFARRGVTLGMDNFTPDRLRSVYGWAQQNGYDDLWMPKGHKPYPLIGEYGEPRVATEPQAPYGK